MSDSLILKVGGRDYTVRPTWRAAADIAAHVVDPYIIGVEMTKVETFAEQGLTYRPSFEFGFSNSVQMLGLAARANGHDLGDDEIGESYMARGAVAAVNDAALLISKLVSPGPAKKPAAPAKPGKAKRQAKTRTGAN